MVDSAQFAQVGRVFPKRREYFDLAPDARHTVGSRDPVSSLSVDDEQSAMQVVPSGLAIDLQPHHILGARQSFVEAKVAEKTGLCQTPMLTPKPCRLLRREPAVCRRSDAQELPSGGIRTVAGDCSRSGALGAITIDSKAFGTISSSESKDVNQSPLI